MVAMTMTMVMTMVAIVMMMVTILMTMVVTMVAMMMTSRRKLVVWLVWGCAVQGTLHIQHSLRTKYSAFKFLMVTMVMMWRSNNIQRSTL